MRSIRTLTRAGLLTLGLLVAGGAVPIPANAGTVLPAPAGVTATRVPAGVKDFVVFWKPVVGALDHYNVSVFYAGQDHIATVPANTTQLAVTGVDFVTQYRITVSTRDVAGVGTTSPVFVLEPAVPGPARSLTAVRDAAATTLTMAWTAPTWPGYQPLTSYDVLVTRLADGVLVSNQSVATLTATVPGLDPTKQYSAKVTARNAYGTGTVATALVGNDRPATSTGLVATRDTKSPSVAHVTWKAPAQVRISGITFQHDPLYGNAFIIRHWYQGTECSTPIAKSAFPAGFAINATHRLIVVVQGDTIWASVDGVEMFRVASLKAAAASSPCKYPLPTGTRIGFRTWNTSPATFENTTLR